MNFNSQADGRKAYHKVGRDCLDGEAGKHVQYTPFPGTILEEAPRKEQQGGIPHSPLQITDIKRSAYHNEYTIPTSTAIVSSEKTSSVLPW